MKLRIDCMTNKENSYVRSGICLIIGGNPFCAEDLIDDAMSISCETWAEKNERLTDYLDLIKCFKFPVEVNSNKIHSFVAADIREYTTIVDIRYIFCFENKSYYIKNSIHFNPTDYNEKGKLEPFFNLMIQRNYEFCKDFCNLSSDQYTLDKNIVITDRCDDQKLNLIQKGNKIL